MGVEIYDLSDVDLTMFVMPREGHGSRNFICSAFLIIVGTVMPREGHGSRNLMIFVLHTVYGCCHAPRGAWE